MAVTKLGKFLRKIRIDYDERMYDMAQRLDVSSSFLSAIEHGKKKLPEELYDKIIFDYNLDEDEQQELKEAMAQNVTKLDVADLPPQTKDAVLLLYRRFDDWSEQKQQDVLSAMKQADKAKGGKLDD